MFKSREFACKVGILTVKGRVHHDRKVNAPWIQRSRCPFSQATYAWQAAVTKQPLREDKAQSQDPEKNIRIKQVKKTEVTRFIISENLLMSSRSVVIDRFLFKPTLMTEIGLGMHIIRLSLIMPEF